ncbi:N-acetylneuraminate lyase [Planctomycetales bacterium]|nr:N-acetylneuraminate lyase [Planctomycetales bacterium]
MSNLNNNFNNTIQGFVAATFTPFNKSGELQLEAIPRYVDYLVQSGMSGLYVCGTNGEGVSMSVEERKQTAEAFFTASAGRIPVIAQIGANSLKDSCELAAHAQSAGIPYISANAPSYFTINSTEVLADYMTQIAAAAPKTPFYYYHIPRFTSVVPDMTKFLQKMESQCPNFFGIKYSDPAVFLYQEALEYKNGKYSILWGCDEMFLSALAVGSQGAVGSTYPLIPQVYHTLLNSWKIGGLPAARKAQQQSWHFVKVLLSFGHIIAVQKAVMSILGYNLGTCRLPIPALSADSEKQLAVALQKFNE